MNKGEDPQTVADRIDAQYGDNITTITSVMEMQQMGDMLNMLQASTWAISLLAIVVGGLSLGKTKHERPTQGNIPNPFSHPVFPPQPMATSDDNDLPF